MHKYTTFKNNLSVWVSASPKCLHEGFQQHLSLISTPQRRKTQGKGKEEVDWLENGLANDHH
jgi:hypothetical protein